MQRRTAPPGRHLDPLEPSGNGGRHSRGGTWTQEPSKKPQETPQRLPKGPTTTGRTERPADGLDQVQHMVHRTNSSGRSAPPGAGMRACAGRCADGKNTYCRREGRGPEVEALAQSAIAEHMGEPCADTPRMLIALVDISKIAPALKLRGAHPPPVALAAPQGGQNDSADQRARRAGQTTQCPVCSCSGRASREARGIPAATGAQWQRRTAPPGRHLDPPVVPAALEPYGNGGRRPRGGNGYVEPPLPQLKVGGVGQRAQNVDTSTLGWGEGYEARAPWC